MKTYKIKAISILEGFVMKKRGLALLLVASMAAGLFGACGSNSSNEGGTTSESGSSDTTQTSSGSSSIVVTGGDITYSVSDSVLSAIASVDTGDLYVTESMINNGLLRDGNVIRIAAAMEKASNGETVTLAFVGGAACEGVGASSSDKSYVNLITDWFKSTFPSATINCVNIGLRETDSYFDVYRINNEVISENPDIVFFDTASDDTGANAEEGYESMIRLVLAQNSKPAVVQIITTNEAFKDDSAYQKSVAYKYDLPVISYADAIETNINNGTWTWSDIGSDDSLNPNDSGHAFIARLVTTYLTRVIEGMSSSNYSQFYVEDVTNTATLCRYENEETAFMPPNNISYEGWDKVSFTDTSLPYGEALETTDGSEVTMYVMASMFGIAYYKSMDGSLGQFDVYVDDELVVTLDGDLSSVDDAEYDYVAFRELGSYSDVSDHKITIKMADDSSAKGFDVLGLLVTK